MAIVARHLSFAYGSLDVLRDVTATAPPGRVTAVLGPNAAGKSTLLRCAIGALRPSAGRVEVDGRSAHALHGAAVARRIAYVPQRPVVSAAFTVRQVIALGRYALPPRPARIDEAIARLDLERIAGRAYPALSVGQQQRVAVARALAQVEPDGHLVLDEPTSAMDLRHAQRCFGILRDLADDGVTVLVALHDLSAAASLADEVWLLDEGRITASGAAGQVLDVERLRDVFGVPFAWLATPDGSRVLVAEPVAYNRPAPEVP